MAVSAVTHERRPGWPAFYASTDADAEAIRLLGSGGSLDGVQVSRDEMRRLARVYGYDLNKAHPLERAGAELSMLRRARVDGVRLAAMLARFLEPGQDPCRLVAAVFAEAGYDTGLLFRTEPDA